MWRDVLLSTGWPPVVANLWLLGMVLLVVLWAATFTALDQQEWLDEHGEYDR